MLWCQIFHGSIGSWLAMSLQYTRALEDVSWGMVSLLTCIRLSDIWHDIWLSWLIRTSLIALRKVCGSLDMMFACGSVTNSWTGCRELGGATNTNVVRLSSCCLWIKQGGRGGFHVSKCITGDSVSWRDGHYGQSFVAKPLAVVDGHLSTVTICLLRLVLGDGAAHVAVKQCPISLFTFLFNQMLPLYIQSTFASKFSLYYLWQSWLHSKKVI